MEKLIVLLDSDGVITNIASHWAEVYNYRYHDNLPPEEFKEYKDIKNRVKSECGSLVFDILKEPSFFEALTPLDGAKDCLSRLYVNPKLEVYIVTSYSGCGEIAKGKLAYFERNFSFFDPKRIILCAHKHLVYGNVLVDDSYENLSKWSAIQSNNGLYDHFSVLVGTSSETLDKRNKVDAVVSDIREATEFIESILCA